MSEQSVCERCLGTGWVLEDAGGSKVAKRCVCYSEHRKQALLEQANIPRRYQHCNFDNYKVLNDSQKDAYKISRKFVENYPVQDVGLLFIGPCGVGKTHLAVSIIQELVLKKNIPCIFYDFRELIREIQSTFTPDSTLTESDILGPVFQSEVLVLDELGAKRTSAWVEETIFYIINYRYNYKRVTIFTTNYQDAEEPPKEENRRDPYWEKKMGGGTGSRAELEKGESLVDRIGIRLRSRIYEMCKVVPMDGEDFRIKIKQAGYRF
ncbi:MAG: ATP-binding protein [Candidatus Aminicenantales bacterium]